MPAIQLNAGQEKLIQTSGKYLSIINSTGSFAIESPVFGSVRGELGRQFELENVRDVVFINTSDKPLNIEYEVANIKVHISGKAGAVSIDNLPAIQEVALQSNEFSVSNLPAVQQVSINAGQSLSVDNFPTEFNVSNLPAVQKVAIEPNQTINVKNASGYSPLAPADFTNGNVIIPKNDNRQTLVLMASEDNEGQIWVGGANVGIPLSTGQPFNLSSNAAVTLHATTATDTCYLAEVTQ